jgi:hypothetical protein
MRRQLAFDIWPLCLAIFLICIFERGKIMNPETSDWFTIFKIIFECTSAYSTIGLSLGTPNNNWSFCGEFGTASKLVVRLYSFSSLLSLPSIHPLILSADLLHWSWCLRWLGLCYVVCRLRSKHYALELINRSSSRSTSGYRSVSLLLYHYYAIERMVVSYGWVLNCSAILLPQEMARIDRKNASDAAEMDAKKQ